jgi:hypothetical protein
MNTLAGLAAAFVSSALVLMGGQDHRAVGIELLTVCVVAAVAGIRSFIQIMKSGSSLPRNSLYRTIGSLNCWLTEIAGAAILIAGSVSGLYIAALAIVVNFYFMISAPWLPLVSVSLQESNSRATEAGKQ